MARSDKSTNKTSHVLNLLTGVQPDEDEVMTSSDGENVESDTLMSAYDNSPMARKGSTDAASDGKKAAPRRRRKASPDPNGISESAGKDNGNLGNPGVSGNTGAAGNASAPVNLVSSEEIKELSNNVKNLSAGVGDLASASRDAIREAVRKRYEDNLAKKQAEEEKKKQEEEEAERRKHEEELEASRSAKEDELFAALSAKEDEMAAVLNAQDQDMARLGGMQESEVAAGMGKKSFVTNMPEGNMADGGFGAGGGSLNDTEEKRPIDSPEGVAGAAGLQQNAGAPNSVAAAASVPQDASDSGKITAEENHAAAESDHSLTPGVKDVMDNSASAQAPGQQRNMADLKGPRIRVEDVQSENDRLSSAIGQQLEATLKTEEEKQLKKNVFNDGGHKPVGFHIVNVMEQILKSQNIREMMEQNGCCTCERCQADVLALTLTRLPSKYVVIYGEDTSPRISFFEAKYRMDILVEIMRAIEDVKARPHHGEQKQY